MKVTEQSFPVSLLIVMLFIVVLAFESVDEVKVFELWFRMLLFVHLRRVKCN